MKYYQYDLFRDFCVSSHPHNIIEEAIKLLATSLKTKRIELTSAEAVKNYCRLNLATREHEIFGALFLDSQHRLIEFRELFRGTIDGCSVYVREVAKEALSLNAAAVIFTHNHPSGVSEPSQADIRITERLKEALTLFDVRVLDHLIVSVEGCVSFAERGIL
jgi:DNA repair protein RadC